MHASIFTMHTGPLKVKEIDFESFDIMFFIHLAKRNVGVLG